MRDAESDYLQRRARERWAKGTERCDSCKGSKQRGKKSAADVRNYIATLFIDGNPKINPHQTKSYSPRNLLST